MIKIIRERDTGKTKELLRKCSECNGIFLCRHPYSIVEKCAAYNISLVEAHGYDYNFELLDRPVFIDDVDDFMKSKFTNVKGISLTSD